MHVPKYLWSNAVLSACHLLNRMHSSVLNGQVPFLVFILSKVFFSLLLVFSVVRVLLRTYLLVWINSPRSIKCVFVRYSRTQKGYRCYSPYNKKYLMSADVTFFESIPYFSLQNLVTASESLFHRLFCCMHLLFPDVSLLVSLENITYHLHQSLLGISDSLYTHRQKVPASEPVLANSSPMKGPPPQHQHLHLILMFLLPFAKVNSLILFILFLILFFYDRLNPSFHRFIMFFYIYIQVI